MGTDRLRYQEAAWHAEQLVKKLGYMILPVNPFDVAKRHEIEVVPNPSSAPGISGCLMKVGDTFGIMYATFLENEGFINFTVSHELGHYFLPGHPQHLFSEGQTLHHSRSGFVSKDSYELDADHFAASLLMPTFLFRSAMNDAGQGFSGIRSLAETCKTSLTATAIRYAALTDDAVAVIVSHDSVIDYCFASDQLQDVIKRERIRKGDSLPRKSETFWFNTNAINIEEAKKAEAWSNLDRWFDEAPSLEMKEDVVGLGSYGKSLTVLFTDEALPDDEE